MNLYLAGEHPVKNGRIAAQRGGNIEYLNRSIIAEAMPLFLP